MTVLAQLIGPFQAVHGRFPDVPELRDLLASEETVAELRAELEAKGGRAGTWVREVDAYRRQARTGQLISLLEDRVALLGRPIFEGFFTAPGSVPGAHRPFSVRALDRPVRARIDLPERGHADVSRILARLLLAQFTVCAVARGDQSLLAGLVLDDAAQTVTSQALRGLQRLRSAHAGVPADPARPGQVAEHLRGPLLGTVGCRAVCAGISPWDGAALRRRVGHGVWLCSRGPTAPVHGIGRHSKRCGSRTVRGFGQRRFRPSRSAERVPAWAL
ncbi:hypothetical protein ACH4RA_34445 [Streptomyces smyrnaeus]|uniref:hypothetical protein n=1 Tax=Streptomyces smyrnaeus TaxID=1387713 RepID=UPI0037B48F1A